MSKNHENVVWQSKDKTWSIGFYEVFPAGFDLPEDYDPEWDVEYDYSRFMFASTGHATEEQAIASWNGPNPGSHTIYSWSKDNAATIEVFERLAEFCLHPEKEAEWKKKETAKLRREHTKKLKALFAENDDFAGRCVNVTIKTDEQPWTPLGSNYHRSGTMKRDGDWLTVEGVKIKNVVTGRLNKQLHSISLWKSIWR